jgi:hypothetical protein
MQEQQRLRCGSNSVKAAARLRLCSWRRCCFSLLALLLLTRPLLLLL